MLRPGTYIAKFSNSCYYNLGAPTGKALYFEDRDGKEYCFLAFLRYWDTIGYAYSPEDRAIDFGKDPEVGSWWRLRAEAHDGRCLFMDAEPISEKEALTLPNFVPDGTESALEYFAEDEVMVTHIDEVDSNENATASFFINIDYNAYSDLLSIALKRGRSMDDVASLLLEDAIRKHMQAPFYFG